MFSIIADDILTEALKKLQENRIGNAVDEESANYLFRTIAQLYAWNSLVKAPIRKTTHGPSYQMMHLNGVNFNGDYLILYSGMKYHKKIFGNGVGVLRMQDYLGMYINCYTENKCSGIIINPLSLEETILTNDCIEYIFKQIYNEVN